MNVEKGRRFIVRIFIISVGKIMLRPTASRNMNLTDNEILLLAYDLLKYQVFDIEPSGVIDFARTIASSCTDAWASTLLVTAIEPINEDPFAATRRAIVRAAAEIGAMLC